MVSWKPIASSCPNQLQSESTHRLGVGEASSRCCRRPRPGGCGALAAPGAPVPLVLHPEHQPRGLQARSQQLQQVFGCRPRWLLQQEGVRASWWEQTTYTAYKGGFNSSCLHRFGFFHSIFNHCLCLIVEQSNKNKQKE